MESVLPGCVVPDEERDTEPSAALSSLPALLLVGGKGGVGKTTLATALALAVAQRAPERQVLLVSTDPAHSLLDALGGALPPPNLEVLELRAEVEFAQFLARHREAVKKIANRGTFLDGEDLEPFLDLAFPGLDELAALKVLAGTMAKRSVDHVIVDTAPTGHTLRLLALPQTIALWRDALDALMEKHRLLSDAFSHGYVPDDADALIDELTELLATVRRVLWDPQGTEFLVVMNADPLSYLETTRLLAELERLDIAVANVVVNRMPPAQPSCRLCTERAEESARWAERARQSIAKRIIEIPELSAEPRGAALLPLGCELLARAWRPENGAEGPCEPIQALSPAPAPRGEPAPAPSCDPALRAALEKASLLFVCGKGGVGKTTVSAALSLHLARATGARVLLFSCDPAHSLSDVLGLEVGRRVREVAPGVDAVEVDPQEKFDEFRETYREEIEQFFDDITRPGSFDAPADRKAMAALVDLAPPGIDEIMALTELTRSLKEAGYSRFVIDTAPSGHFLRFIEMPDLLWSWVRGIFAILSKHSKEIRLPRVTRYLIDLTRALRKLRARLIDEEMTLALPVAIPTILSLEETADLVERLGQLGMGVRHGVLNRVYLEPSECAHCRAKQQDTHRFISLYRERLPDVSFRYLTERGTSPVGVGPLRAVADGLFGKDEAPRG